MSTIDPQTRPSLQLRRGLRSAALSLCVGLLATPGCRDAPTTPGTTRPPSAWDMGATAQSFAVENADGTLSDLQLVASNITWAPDSGILSAQVALRNDGSATVQGPASVAVFDFVPEDVVPLNAVCGIVPGPCWFEYQDAYGNDGMLSPGETSEAREWQILNASGEGFRFRTRLMPGPDAGGRVAGVCFDDVNRNGRRDANEPGIPGVGVSFKVVDRPAIQITDERGAFELRVEQPGLYTVVTYTSSLAGWIPTTPSELQVVVFRRPDGTLSDFLHADFGFAQQEVPGPGVGGTVYRDDNRNGVHDPNEAGVAGVDIWVMPFPPDARSHEPCALQPLIVKTDRGGNWQVPAGGMSCESPWLVQRAPILGSDPNGLPLPLFGTTPRDLIVYGIDWLVQSVAADFGVAPFDNSQPQIILVVEGQVYVDVNENGVRDVNEPGASGVRLELLSPCDRLESSWANTRGAYRFEPPMTDWCPIGGVAVSTARQVTSENPILFPTPTTPGVHVIHADFGVRPVNVLPQ